MINEALFESKPANYQDLEEILYTYTDGFTKEEGEYPLDTRKEREEAARILNKYYEEVDKNDLDYDRKNEGGTVDYKVKFKTPKLEVTPDKDPENFNQFVDDSFEDSPVFEALLEKDYYDEALEKATPYMLRNDGKLIKCELHYGNYHPYILSVYDFDNDLESLVIDRMPELEWFYNNTNNKHTKEYISIIYNSLLGRSKQFNDSDYVAHDDELKQFAIALNNEVNNEFCRVRTSNVKYGGDNNDIYFRISSVGFNWFPLIWDVVAKNKEISNVTITRDNDARNYNQGDCYRINGKEIDHMSRDEFLTLKGNPVVEKFKFKQSIINKALNSLDKGKSLTESFLNVHPRYMNNYYNSIKKHQLENDMNIHLNEAIEKHDTLNPDLWDENNELLPDVKEKLQEIVNKFISNLEENDIKLDVEDICIIGSNASYNYNDQSDIDLHIIADPSIYSDEDLALKIYLAYKSLFNNKYDPLIRGHEVEIYVEPHEVQANSKGIYSLNSGWLKEPENMDIPDIDQQVVDDYLAPFIEKFNDVITAGTIEDVDKLIDDIYLERQKSIMKDGEFAIPNLAFKEFRSNGYLQKLRDRKTELENDNMSLNDSFNEELNEGTAFDTMPGYMTPEEVRAKRLADQEKINAEKEQIRAQKAAERKEKAKAERARQRRIDQREKVNSLSYDSLADMAGLPEDNNDLTKDELLAVLRASMSDEEILELHKQMFEDYEVGIQGGPYENDDDYILDQNPDYDNGLPNPDDIPFKDDYELTESHKDYDLIFDRDTGDRQVEYGINWIQFTTDNYDDAVRWARQLDAAMAGDFGPGHEPSDDPKYYDPENYPGDIQEIGNGKFNFRRRRDILDSIEKVDFVDADDDIPFDESLNEDTVKQGDKWVNKGKEGTHGKFKTKKAADDQRKAMFANGYHESLNNKKESIKMNEEKVVWSTHMTRDNLLSLDESSKMTALINREYDREMLEGADLNRVINEDRYMWQEDLSTFDTDILPMIEDQTHDGLVIAVDNDGAFFVSAEDLGGEYASMYNDAKLIDRGGDIFWQHDGQEYELFALPDQYSDEDIENPEWVMQNCDHIRNLADLDLEDNQLEEAKSKDPNELKTELDEIIPLADEYGFKYFTSMPFSNYDNDQESFEYQYPEVARHVKSFFKEMGILSSEEINDSDVMDEQWEIGFDQHDWDVLMRACEKMAKGSGVQFEKEYKTGYNSPLDDDEIVASREQEESLNEDVNIDLSKVNSSEMEKAKAEVLKIQQLQKFKNDDSLDQALKLYAVLGNKYDTDSDMLNDLEKRFKNDANRNEFLMFYQDFINAQKNKDIKVYDYDDERADKNWAKMVVSQDSLNKLKNDLTNESLKSNSYDPEEDEPRTLPADADDEDYEDDLDESAKLTESLNEEKINEDEETVDDTQIIDLGDGIVLQAEDQETMDMVMDNLEPEKDVEENLNESISKQDIFNDLYDCISNIAYKYEVELGDSIYREDIEAAVKEVLDKFFADSSDFNEGAKELKEDANDVRSSVSEYLSNELFSFNDNLAMKVADAVPEYNADWCLDSGDNELVNKSNVAEAEFVDATLDVLFANAPRTESLQEDTLTEPQGETKEYSRTEDWVTEAQTEGELVDEIRSYGCPEEVTITVDDLEGVNGWATVTFTGNQELIDSFLEDAGF